ncbi:hypothetical protein hrd7_07930 [Leptolinea sp. HRD-7]|jgi:hypothetical protein|nr:hypothetical protein hrd7_07930 [Leptolinea sp. HRD-7]
MALTLTEMRTRVSLMLMDTGEEIWPQAILDEAIRQALTVYSLACPCEQSAVLTMPARGDLDLGSLPGLAGVTAVRWPYAVDRPEALQPANRVTGWRCWRDMDKNTLELRTLPGTNPMEGESLLVRYITGHSIGGLDGAEVSTIQLTHIALLIQGSAGYAALFRALDKVENRSYGSRRTEPALLQRWADGVLERFQRELDKLRRQYSPAETQPAWRMDAWESC